MVNTNLNRKMANQQHQQNIKTANEKGRQRRQLMDGDSIILRDCRWNLKSEVVFRADCQEDRFTDVRGAGGARDYLVLSY